MIFYAVSTAFIIMHLESSLYLWSIGLWKLKNEMEWKTWKKVKINGCCTAMETEKRKLSAEGTTKYVGMRPGVQHETPKPQSPSHSFRYVCESECSCIWRNRFSHFHRVAMCWNSEICILGIGVRSPTHILWSFPHSLYWNGVHEYLHAQTCGHLSESLLESIMSGWALTHWDITRNW